MKYLFFGVLTSALVVGMTGCFGEDIENLKKDVAEIQENHGDGTQYALKSVVDGLSTSLTELQGKLGTAEGKISTLETELAAVRAIAEAAQTEAEVAAAIKAESDILKGLINAKADAATLTSEVLRLEGLIDDVNTLISQANAKITTLRTDVDGILADYIDSGKLAAALAPYMTTADFNTAIGDYVKSTDLTTILLGYPTNTQMADAIASAINAFETGVFATLKGQVEALETWQTTMNGTVIPGLEAADKALNDFLYGEAGTPSSPDPTSFVGQTVSDIAALQLGKLDNDDPDYLALVAMYTTYYADIQDIANIRTLAAANEANIEALEDRFNDFAGSGGTIEAYIADMITRIEDLEDADDELLAKIEEIYTAPDGGILGNLITTVEGILVGLQDVADRVDTIEGRLDNFTPASGSPAGSIEKYLFDLVGRVSVNEGNITTLQSEMVTAKQDIIDIKADIVDIKADIADIYDILDTLVTKEAVHDMITEISIIEGKEGTTEYPNGFGFEGSVVRETRDFGLVDKGMIEFVAGQVIAQKDTKATLLVQVNPVHADLSAAEFVLFDSQKKDYIEDGIFTVAAAPYTGGVLTRAVDNTGLWKVTVTPVAGKTLPAEGTLLSLGVVNNIDDDTAAETRIVATKFAPVIITDTYTSVYFTSSVNNFFGVYKVGGTRWTTNNGTKAIIGFPNTYTYITPSYTEQIWATAPAVSGGGVFTSGTEGNGDDRSPLTPVEVLTLLNVDEGKNVNQHNVSIQVYPHNASLRPYAFYTTLDELADPARLAIWEQIGIVGPGDEEIGYVSYDIGNTRAPYTKAYIPFSRILHRENVGFRTHAVNRDGTLIDPDGMAFNILMKVDNVVVPTPSMPAPAESVVTLDNNYDGSNINMLADNSSAVEIDLNVLGFRPEMLEKMSATYSVELAGAAYVIDGSTQNPHYSGSFIPGTSVNATNELLGTLQTSTNGTTWTDIDVTGTTVADWSAVTHIRFANIDPKAMEPGVTYSGTLVLKEEDWDIHTGITDPITITIPVELSLVSDFEFDPLFGFLPGKSSPLYSFPVPTGSTDVNLDFTTTFSPLTPAITFEMVNPNPDFTFPSAHVLNVDNYATYFTAFTTPTPAPTIGMNIIYTGGPVWNSVYGDGVLSGDWEDNPFKIMFLQYMEWHNIVKAAPTTDIVLSTGGLDLPANTFKVVSKDATVSNANFALGSSTSMSFDGTQRIVSIDVITTNATGVYDWTSTPPAGINDYFTPSYNLTSGMFQFVASGSTPPTGGVDAFLAIKVTDDFDTEFIYEFPIKITQ